MALSRFCRRAALRQGGLTLNVPLATLPSRLLSVDAAAIVEQRAEAAKRELAILAHAFQRYDGDRNGTLDRQEIKHALDGACCHVYVCAAVVGILSDFGGVNVHSCMRPRGHQPPDDPRCARGAHWSIRRAPVCATRSMRP
jgi:hypothetical protein